MHDEEQTEYSITSLIAKTDSATYHIARILYEFALGRFLVW